MKYKNLVLEGGGIKGIAYVGALKELENEGILQNIENVAGTSAGAITAVLIALNYTPDEIYDIMFNIDFNYFVDKSKWKSKNIYDIITKFGIAKGNSFEVWINEIIYNKTRSFNTTFEELNNLKNTRNLKIVGTNLSKKTIEIFSNTTTPNMQISKAVRISMSIPLFFQAVKYNNDIYIDGSLFWNYPLSIYDKDNIVNPHTIGLRIDSTITTPKIQKSSFINYLKHQHRQYL
jgi:NTE family protein